MVKSIQRKSKVVRHLITSVTRYAGSNNFRVEVLQADTANLANDTGTAATWVLTKEQVESLQAFHEIKTLKGLRGAPINGRVTFDSSNVLGRSSFHSNVY